MKASYPTPLTTSNALELVVKQPSEAEPIENRDPEIFGSRIFGSIYAREGSITGGNYVFSVASAGDTAGLISYAAGGSTRICTFNANAQKNIYRDVTTVQVDGLFGLYLIRFQ